MVLALAFPTTCPVCGRAGPAPCRSCWARLKPAPAGGVPLGLEACRSLLLYEGAASDMIARLKYRNARAALAWLAAGMAMLVRSASWPRPDVVTWAPTTPVRRRERGFDQAELLARAVARELGLPCRRLLARGPGPPQTGRPAAARWSAGVAFTAAGAGRSPPPEVVLLVDDVITTGATLAAAANALTTAGVIRVNAVTAGRTPLKLRERQADD